MRSEVEQVILILERIKERLQNGRTAFWAGVDNEGEVILKINLFIHDLREGRKEVLNDISLCFAPTGLFQELSISGGWADEFLLWSEEFDLLVNRLSAEDKMISVKKAAAKIGKMAMGTIAMGCLALAVLTTYLWYSRGRLVYNENYRAMDENGVMFDSDGIVIYGFLSICFWSLGIVISVIYLKK